MYLLPFSINANKYIPHWASTVQSSTIITIQIGLHGMPHSYIFSSPSEHPPAAEFLPLTSAYCTAAWKSHGPNIVGTSSMPLGWVPLRCPAILSAGVLLFQSAGVLHYVFHKKQSAFVPGALYNMHIAPCVPHIYSKFSTAAQLHVAFFHSQPA